jgi:hypothetical protein
MLVAYLLRKRKDGPEETQVSHEIKSSGIAKQHGIFASLMNKAKAEFS